MKNRKLYLIAIYLLGCYVSFSQGAGLPADNTPPPDPPKAPIDNVYYILIVTVIALLFVFNRLKKMKRN